MSKAKARIIKSYHYIESGLDNVYLEEMVESNGDDMTLTVPIRKVHQCIARSIIDKAGKINGKEIRFLRTEMGLTHEALAEKLGVSESEIVKWEQGKAKIRNAVDRELRILMFSSLVDALLPKATKPKGDPKKVAFRIEKDGWRCEVAA